MKFKRRIHRWYHHRILHPTGVPNDRAQFFVFCYAVAVAVVFVSAVAVVGAKVSHVPQTCAD